LNKLPRSKPQGIVNQLFPSASQQAVGNYTRRDDEVVTIIA